MGSFTLGYVSFQIVVLLVVLAILGRSKGWSALQHVHVNFSLLSSQNYVILLHSSQSGLR